MNGRQKGKRIELEFRRLLEDHSFLVNPTPPGSKWNKQTDHWSLFDLEAVSAVDPFYTFFFQIATRWKAGVDREKIEAFPASKARLVYMVRRKDRGDFEMRSYEGNMWTAEDISAFLMKWGRKGISGRLKGIISKVII